MTDERIKLLHGDCLEQLRTLPDKSVNLVLTDPPYNIKLADWDKWKTPKLYVEFMQEVFKECERVLVDNGSLYFFHSDMEQVAMLMEMIRQNLNFVFNSFIIWDKGDFRSLAWKHVTDANKLRQWFNTCEYCLYFTKGESKTGWETVHLDVNNFASLRKYAYELMQFIGLTGGGIERKLGHRKAEHFFYCQRKKVGNAEDRGSG